MAVDLAAVGVPPATPRADIAAATEHMRAALAALGFDTSRDGVQRTPERFVRALDELTWGRHLDPRRHLATTFRAEGHTSIAVRGIPVTSVCEHHLLVFDGVAVVMYVPVEGARIVGLSKLARVAQEYAARATVQERLTTQIADAVEQCLATRGVAVLVRSDHSCMSSRGARAHGADTVTDDYRGLFTEDTAARVEFLIKALGAAPVAGVEELGGGRPVRT